MTDPAREREPEVIASKLTLGQVVPSFALPAAVGNIVRSRDYKGRRNLVLFLMHSATCDACVDRLRDFARRYGEYRDLEAEILAIAPGPQQGVEKVAVGLPFPVLADVGGEVSFRSACARPGEADAIAGILITDRYGALYHQSLSRRDADLPDQSAILEWLLFVGIQCEECGVPEWPAHGLGDLEQ